MMEVAVIDAKKTLEKRGGYFVRVSPEEALRLIQSLTEQMLTKSPNSGRLETYTKDGKYFSIAVTQGRRGEGT